MLHQRIDTPSKAEIRPLLMDYPSRYAVTVAFPGLKSMSHGKTKLRFFRNICERAVRNHNPDCVVSMVFTPEISNIGRHGQYCLHLHGMMKTTDPLQDAYLANIAKEKWLSAVKGKSSCMVKPIHDTEGWVDYMLKDYVGITHFL